MNNMYIQRKIMLETGKINNSAKVLKSWRFYSFFIFKTSIILYFSYYNQKIIKVIEYFMFNFCMQKTSIQIKR